MAPDARRFAPKFRHPTERILEIRQKRFAHAHDTEGFLFDDTVIHFSFPLDGDLEADTGIRFQGCAVPSALQDGETPCTL